MKTKGEKAPTTQTRSVYLYMRGGANHVQRGGEGGNKVSLHVSVSRFRKQDSVIAGGCFRFPLCIDILEYLKKTLHAGARDSNKKRNGGRNPLPRKEMLCSSVQLF